MSVQALVLCAVLYVARMFGVCAGYHRYFSHRSYAASRPMQFALALLAQSSAQSSVLWWAAKHRHHHRFSDTEHDVHSPLHRGFFYSHLGWIFDRRNKQLDLVEIDDLAAYPELCWLHRFELAPALLLAAFSFAVAGWSGLVVGFLWSTVLVYHATFCINSVAHVRGSRRYITADGSRNNLVLAIVTLGEGWHNNHHAWQSSARQGFRWWEVDLTYYGLLLLRALGLVRDLKSPPPAVLANAHRIGGRTLQRAAEQLAAAFHPDAIAAHVRSAAHPKAGRVPHPGAADASAWARELIHHAAVPSLDVVLAKARSTFPTSQSIERIAEKAHQIILAAIGERLLQGDPATVPSSAGCPADKAR